MAHEWHDPLRLAVTQVADQLREIHGLLVRVVGAIEALAPPAPAPPTAQPKIATYEDMYGPIPTPAPPVPPPPPRRSSLVHRWLFKEISR